jgi:hypothetical protein
MTAIENECKLFGSLEPLEINKNLLAFPGGCIYDIANQTFDFADDRTMIKIMSVLNKIKTYVSNKKCKQLTSPTLLDILNNTIDIKKHMVIHELGIVIIPELVNIILNILVT